MSVVQFSCPSCQAPLRLQNRALFVGRTFDCPDCHESLLIEADGSTGVKAKALAGSDKPARRASEGSGLSTIGDPSLARRASLKTASSVSDIGVSSPLRPSAWDRLSRRPAVLGWIVAAVFAVILLIVVKPSRDRTLTELAPPAKKDSQPTESTSDNKPAIEEPDKVNPAAVAELESAVPEIDSPKVVAKLELPPLPEPPAVVEPAPVTEKPPTEEPKPVAPAVLSVEAVEAKLQQKIVRFDQSKPVPFVKVLDTVEELAGVPIVWDLDRVDDEQLQKPVTLQLKQTTVGEILDTLLKQVGLERRTVDGRIELLPMTVPRP